MQAQFSAEANKFEFGWVIRTGEENKGTEDTV